MKVEITLTQKEIERLATAMVEQIVRRELHQMAKEDNIIQAINEHFSKKHGECND